MATRTAGHHHIGTSAPAEDPVDIGHLWTDTTTPALKRCTSLSPVTWVSTEGVGGGAPTDASYLALGTNGTLTSERVLTPANGIEGADAGAGSTYTIQPTYGSTANTVCQGNDSRLSDARTPTAHTHPIATEITGITGTPTGSKFLRDDFSWQTPSGGSSWTEAEVDFGSNAPKSDAVFTITDAAVTAASKITVIPCGKAATGRTADDWQWDGIVFAANPGSGSFTLYANVVGGGSVKGPRKIQYSVAS